MGMDIELDKLFQNATKIDFASAPNVFLNAVQSLESKGEKLKKEKLMKNEPDVVKKEKVPEDPERLDRTIFIGNVPVKIVKDRKLCKSLKILFEKFGPVESMRIRSLVMDKKVTSKRVAFITGRIDPSRDSCTVYIVMKNKEDALQTVDQMNGQLFEGHHLRCDLSSNSDSKPSTKKSVFVGNLSYTVKEESLWELFNNCGTISYVRIIRDSTSGAGKGFGYVAFKDKSSLDLALKLNGSSCDGRPIRVTRCSKPGYQQIKKERIAKRHESRNKDTKSDVSMATERQNTSFIANQRGSKSLSSLKQLPNLVPKSMVPTEESTADRKKHPAEIRKERKLKKTMKTSFNVNKQSFKHSNRPSKIRSGNFKKIVSK